MWTLQRYKASVHRIGGRGSWIYSSECELYAKACPSCLARSVLLAESNLHLTSGLCLERQYHPVCLLHTVYFRKTHLFK